MGRRFAAALVAAIGGFVVAAVAVTLLDLYLSGHGRRGLGERRLIDAERAGVHLSVADGVALGVGVVAAAAAAATSGPRRG